MIIRLFIFNTYTWHSIYINVSIKTGYTSQMKENFTRGLMEQTKLPDILILTDNR
jgi:hypothetical protein